MWGGGEEDSSLFLLLLSVKNVTCLFWGRRPILPEGEKKASRNYALYVTAYHVTCNMMHLPPLLFTRSAFNSIRGMPPTRCDRGGDLIPTVVSRGLAL